MPRFFNWDKTNFARISLKSSLKTVQICCLMYLLNSIVSFLITYRKLTADLPFQPAKMKSARVVLRIALFMCVKFRGSSGVRTFWFRKKKGRKKIRTDEEYKAGKMRKLNTAGNHTLLGEHHCQKNMLQYFLR